MTLQVLTTKSVADSVATGKNIQSARWRKHWTLQELADRSGVGRAQISYIENGKRNPSPKTLRKIEQALRGK